MTREEARQWFLKVYSEIKGKGYADENEEAYELAIKALEKEPCEECEHNDGECCRILFERSFEQNPNLEKLRAEIERATIEMDYETAKETLAVIDRYIEQEPCDDVVSRQEALNAVTFSEVRWQAIERIKQLPPVRPQLNEQAAEWYKLFVEKFDSCDDAISRQAVLASIKNLYPDMPIVDIFGARRKWLEKYAPYFECENAVEQLPSVRPQEQTGHWIMSGDGLFRPICDKCGAHPWKAYIPTVEEATEVFKYCPNCGARMVEPTCETCEYNTAAFTPCNACEDMSEYELRERSDKA